MVEACGTKAVLSMHNKNADESRSKILSIAVNKVKKVLLVISYVKQIDSVFLDVYPDCGNMKMRNILDKQDMVS